VWVLALFTFFGLIEQVHQGHHDDGCDGNPQDIYDVELPHNFMLCMRLGLRRTHTAL
jgi:hypothetical protein